MNMLVATMKITDSAVFSEDRFTFEVGEREIIATKQQRDALGLKWYVDGNLGVIKSGDRYVMYGANGSSPYRVTGTFLNHFEKVEPVKIISSDSTFRYMAGGPLFLDPESKRILLFYHAEVYRGDAKNFYSVLGLSIQTDDAGLIFNDLGPVFSANIPEEKAMYPTEICGAPYILKDGYFYVYARDEFLTGEPRQSNLSVARAKVSEVLKNSRKGQRVRWKKYYDGDFSEPANGGRSTPLEEGNPRTRWMDLSYNTEIGKYIMVAATTNAGSEETKAELCVTWSDDGIYWAKRVRLVDEGGECFYPSIIGLQDSPRQTGKTFFIYYTFSEKGAWDRWGDAVIVRRKVTVRYPDKQQDAPTHR